MRITFVKKVLADGTPCSKCRDVEEKLRENDQLHLINETVVADERDADSPGMSLAREHQVTRAPFFLVEEEGQIPRIYTVYFKFVKEVLRPLTT
ncbi:hypothetical protein [Microbulbifer guangxiensis]|uniref:hypothetical protein n=1 Tax=Microbulbifer guangxiensis TaxID=2904249 RepID=UPI001F22DCC0|nr:hypothetical protein [Microbulbifer guangxiensis]